MKKQKPLVGSFKTLNRVVRPVKVYNRDSFKPIKNFSIDSRSIKRGEAFIALLGKHCDGHEFILKAVAKGAACIVAQKYIPIKSKIPFLVVKDSYKSLVSIARYVREKRKPFIYAITGSIGKTTTKEVLHFLLKDHCRVLKNKKTENNLLGVAKTILSLRDQEVLIAELGTSQKGEIRSLSKMLVPDVGVITFIKPVHLEGLGSLENIFHEKLSLRSGNAKMKLVLNADDPYLKKVKANKKIYWFGTKPSNHVFAGVLRRNQEHSEFLIQNSQTLLLPRYLEGFISNILAAILAGHLYGINLKELIAKIKKFKNYPEMRMQLTKLNRLIILNDAYNANPYSVKEALTNLRDYPLKKIAIIGDMLELGKKSIYYHRLLARDIVKNNFDYCLTLGSYTRYLKKRLSDLGYRGAFHFCSHKDLAGFINRKIIANNDSDENYLIFLKGSRKMELERVVSHLK